MRRASCLLVAAAVLSIAAPSGAHAQSKSDLTKFQNREMAVWESVKNKEIESLGRVFEKNYVGVYDEGILGKAEELDGISKLTLRSYQISDLRILHVDASNVVVTYKVMLDADMQGQSMSGSHNALTVWHRSGNRWSVSAHTDVKAK